MTFEEIKLEIKKTVQEIIPGCVVYIFGSYARGENNFDSDIDLLLVTEQNMPIEEKADVLVNLHQILVKRIKRPFDILLNSKDEVERRKILPGHILKTAMREGIIV